MQLFSFCHQFTHLMYFFVNFLLFLVVFQNFSDVFNKIEHVENLIFSRISQRQNRTRCAFTKVQITKQYLFTSRINMHSHSHTHALHYECKTERETKLNWNAQNERFMPMSMSLSFFRMYRVRTICNMQMDGNMNIYTHIK